MISNYSLPMPLDLAIILAAGEGKRLRPLTDEQPKCLIPIAGKSFLERTLTALDQIGLHNICIVAGYYSDLVKEFVDSHFHNVNARVCVNPDYAETNNAYSLALGLKKCEDHSFLLLDGDLLYDFQLLESLINDRRQDVVIVETERDGLDQEAMKVVLDPQNYSVQEISKDITLNEASGEFIGMGKFSAEWTQLLRNSFEQHITNDAFRDMYYENVMQPLLNQAPPLYGLATEGLPWAEVDTAEDLQIASARWNQ